MKNLKISLKVFFKTISPPLKIAVVGVFLVIFTFMACQKDSIDNLNKTTENSVSIQEFRANIDPLEKLVLNPDDKAAEFINKSNVEIAKVLIDLVTREDINRFIVETAKANEGNVYYEQVFKQFPDIKPLFKNTVIGKRGISKSFECVTKTGE